MPFKWLIVATILLSVTFSLSAIVGLTAFVPVISIIAGYDLGQIEKIPYVGKLVLSLSDDRATIFYTMLGAIVTLSLAKAGLQLMTQMIEISCKSRIESLWQQRIIGSWLNAPYEHHSAESAGRIMHLSSREILQMGEAARAFASLVAGLIQAAIAVAFLALLAPLALAGVCVVVGCIIVPISYIIRRAHHASKEDAMQTGNYIGRTQDIIKRIELIDIYGTAAQEKTEVGNFFERYLESYFKFHLNNALGPFVIQVSLSALMAGLLIFFFQQGAGQETLATVVLFIGGMVLIHPQMDRITQAINMLTRMGAAFDTIEPVVSLPVRRVARHGGDAVPDFKSSAITFENVSFMYRASNRVHRIVDNVSIDLPTGGLYMLFGPTGVGKTTMLRLMQGLLPPDGGAIRYGGIELGAMSQELISRTVLMMPQDRPTFTGTVRENVGYGILGLSDQTISDALRLAGADEFVNKLPNGLDTHIGNDGSLLSGGQRQRIALARIIAAAPKVMLLDEPTSSLDREMEHRIIGTLYDLRNRGHTIIMSTHKVELAPLADTVLWFEEGRIHVGTFEDFHHSLAELIPHDDMRRALAFDPQA